MTDVEYANLPGIEGFLTRAEAEILEKYASGVILEVGSHFGRSTVVLARKGTVHAVDPWGEVDKMWWGSDLPPETQFDQNTKGLPVVKHKMRIEDWAPMNVDFAYLDGDHSTAGTRAQIGKALQCNPSIIAVHDMDTPSVVQATLELLGPPTEQRERVGIWVL